MKLFIKKHKLSIIIISFLLVIGGSTLLVGNYFVDYALVPYSGGQDRESVVDELPDGVQVEDQSTQVQVEIQAAKEDRLVNDWLQETIELTHQVELTSHDGLTLRGHAFYQGNETADWAVMVHGYQVDEEQMYPIAHHYYDEGYNVLTFDQRGLGDSDDDYLTMGIKEQKDLITWLKALVETHPEAKIVTHGESMGSGTVLMASGLEEFPKEVIAIVSDSGYSSVWEIFASELYQRFQLPAFPFLHMAAVVAIPRVGINLFNEGVTTESVSKSTTPTLFIHGTADDFVPYPMVEDLYQAHPTDDKDLLIIEGAAHTDSKYLEPDLYYETIFSFIDRFK